MPALELRGVELSWSERGAGPPALFVHGTGSDSSSWGPTLSELGTGVRAIAYDRRGWGRSSSPEGYGRTTIEEQSEDAAALLEALEAAPAVICGAGSGAVIALDLLLRLPELTASALLLEPPLLSLLPEATELLSADRDTLEGAARKGREALVELYLSGELGALSAGAERIPPELSAAGREHPLSLIAELGMVPGWRMPVTRLARAERPSVVVTASSSPPVVSAAGSALARRLAGSELRDLDSDPLPPELGAPGEVAGLVLALADG